MNFDIEALPLEIEFIYLALTKSAINIKMMGKKKDFFLDLCNEIWDSMELHDLNKLDSILHNHMKSKINEK